MYNMKQPVLTAPMILKKKKNETKLVCEYCLPWLGNHGFQDKQFRPLNIRGGGEPSTPPGTFLAGSFCVKLQSISKDSLSGESPVAKGDLKTM